MAGFKPKPEILNRIVKILVESPTEHTVAEIATAEKIPSVTLVKYLAKMAEMKLISYNEKKESVIIEQEGFDYWNAIKATNADTTGYPENGDKIRSPRFPGVVESREQGLVISKDVVKPVVTPGEAKAFMKQWQELTKALLEQSDYISIQGNVYKKKSAWRKYAKAFNISDKILEKQFLPGKDGSIIYAEFTVEARAPNGRTCIGWGSCSASERKFAKPNHDIPATAHTRAKNRAISDLIGAGEVSAEEIQ